MNSNLVFRPTVYSDLEQFYKWELTDEVKAFFSIEDNQSFEDVVRAYILSEEDPAQRQFTMELDGEIFGRIIISDIIDGWKCEVLRIYIGNPENRGKGYGREAMEWTLNYCFEELKMQRVYLDYYTGNPAQFLYENLGMTHEGTQRNNCRKNGILYDVNLMSILSDEFESGKKK